MSMMMMTRGRGGTVSGGDPLTIAIVSDKVGIILQPTDTSDLVITLTRGGGHTADVTLAVAGLPTGVAASYVDSNTFAGATTTRTVRLTSTAATEVSLDAATITASSGGVSDSVVNITVTVADGLTEGPGANAPAWVGKTTYDVQNFTTPMPVVYDSAVNGFQGYQGFPSAYGNSYLPTRVTYPTVDTPFGSRAVIQLEYPGQIENITASAQATTAYPFNSIESTEVAIRITGTWTGTLQFEQSDDGVTGWTALSMYSYYLANEDSDGSQTYAGSSASTNGTWGAATSGGLKYFRARASSWTSGTAVVSVGLLGGQSPARGLLGTFNSAPTRVYYRIVYWASPEWFKNRNVGEKFFFFSQTNEGGQQNNHYIGLIDLGTSEPSVVTPYIGIQKSGYDFSYNISPSQTFALDTWHDLELIIETGTAGGTDGVVKLWMNGIQVINESTIKMFGSAQTPRIDTMWLDPTHGGGVRPSTGDNRLRIAHIYRESAA